MPAILRSLQRLLSLFEEKHIAYMVIGGYALPFYGRSLCIWLRSIDFEPAVASFLNPVVVILDLKERVEIELWLKPDGIVLDDETLKRRSKAKLNLNVETWIVSPEDFTVNKLARPDRGVNDEQDVKSVLVRQEGRLDQEYLTRRAEKVGVLQILNRIEAHNS